MNRNNNYEYVSSGKQSSTNKLPDQPPKLAHTQSLQTKSPNRSALSKNKKSNSFIGKSSSKLKEFTSGSKTTPSKAH